jgi:hypothetical protein
VAVLLSRHEAGYSVGVFADATASPEILAPVHRTKCSANRKDSATAVKVELAKPEVEKIAVPATNRPRVPHTSPFGSTPTPSIGAHSNRSDVMPPLRYEHTLHAARQIAIEPDRTETRFRDGSRQHPVRPPNPRELAVAHLPSHDQPWHAQGIGFAAEQNSRLGIRHVLGIELQRIGSIRPVQKNRRQLTRRPNPSPQPVEAEPAQSREPYDNAAVTESGAIAEDTASRMGRMPDLADCRFATELRGREFRAEGAIGYVVYRCTTLDGCTITENDHGFCIGASCVANGGPNYIIIDGFTLDGTASPTTFGQGVQLWNGNITSNNTSAHHIFVLNSIIKGMDRAACN